MIELDALSSAFSLLTSSWSAWPWVIPGLAVGLFFGAMPGISITMAMAIFLPTTLYMDFLPAIIFLTSIYTGAGFGGSVPAVLMNIPAHPRPLPPRSTAIPWPAPAGTTRRSGSRSPPR